MFVNKALANNDFILLSIIGIINHILPSIIRVVISTLTWPVIARVIVSAIWPYKYE